MDSMEQFEAWAISQGLNVSKAKSCGSYEKAETYYAWRVWQASREALVVEIPKGLLLVEEADVIDDIVNQLEKAGIKWK